MLSALSFALFVCACVYVYLNIVPKSDYLGSRERFGVLQPVCSGWYLSKPQNRKILNLGIPPIIGRIMLLKLKTLTELFTGFGAGVGVFWVREVVDVSTFADVVDEAAMPFADTQGLLHKTVA